MASLPPWSKTAERGARFPLVLLFRFGSSSFRRRNICSSTCEVCGHPAASSRSPTPARKSAWRQQEVRQDRVHILEPKLRRPSQFTTTTTTTEMSSSPTVIEHNKMLHFHSSAIPTYLWQTHSIFAIYLVTRVRLYASPKRNRISSPVSCAMFVYKWPLWSIVQLHTHNSKTCNSNLRALCFPMNLVVVFTI